MIRGLATSPDGLWAVARAGREAWLLAGGAGPPAGHLVLDGDDAELAFVGPPSALLAIARAPGATRVALYQPPLAEPVARLELDLAARLGAITGPRLALIADDRQHVVLVRAAGAALAHHTIDAGAPIELVVGLERNQLLLAVARELKVYDAVSGRPLLRLGLQLPPMPRTMGSAAGHAWAIRGGGQRSGPDRFAGADDVFVYRLSDGRPFRHVVGEPIEAIISHPASPILVVVTARRLIRLHCFAHSLTLIDAPAWRPGDALAQLVVGDDISLLGLAEDATEPWRLAIGGAGAPLQPTAAEPSEPAAMVTAADRFRQMRAGSGEAATAAAPSAPVRAPAPWRDPLASYGNELARGVDAEPPQVGAEHELGELAQRLALSAAARRALVALYALHLIGAPGLAIARLARALGDWTEPLGQGELAALAMISRVRGRV
ncbi:MAG TPA: hypothetical protein VLX92_02200, partial [Kofleriaceae bacterium]|nr:hypothetical protein [Kofleriaceae bacterium]